MKPYRCRYCGTMLFRSDAPSGNVKVLCPNRECQSRRKQGNRPPIVQTVPLAVADRK